MGRLKCPKCGRWMAYSEEPFPHWECMCDEAVIFTLEYGEICEWTHEGHVYSITLVKRWG